MRAGSRGHPRAWVAAACAELGETAVLESCLALLDGADPSSVELSLEAIGGPGAAEIVRSSAPYFARVWAARAMLYVWPAGDRTTRELDDVLRRRLGDEHWRVREMCAKVVRRHEVGAAADALVPLLLDPVPRVRGAAARALGAVGEHEHLEPLQELADDPEPAVRDARARAQAQLEVRLDLT